MTVAQVGSLKQRRELVESMRDVVPVAPDLFQLGRESEIAAACDGHSLPDLLRLSLVDYRNRYTDTRREHLIRRDVDPKHGRDTLRKRSLVCLFCAEVLAIRATTSQSYRIAQLMIEEPTDDDRDISVGYRFGFHVKLTPSGEPAVWCVADVREAIRPHVVTCALASLGHLQVPQRPDAKYTRRYPGGLFEEAHRP